ncbi:uncharacterized protein LOC117792094 isoform X1 [Drosophila innubila]|uniref:uncharacterized protein LOC117792094 isoform X1 n=1 Tax=Drosophila innubila TaxID=198719 RepID=UPI00148D55B4|nr:uncharacterized protein LOC117792094 isoform X1 [Drosophila innubila]
MESNSEMLRSKEEAGLDNLNRQLQSMEKMLKKADEYNDTLAERINRLKDIFRSNQRVFDKLEDNQKSINQIFRDEGENELNSKKLIPHITSIENKLLVTVNLFNDYKCRVKDMSYTQDADMESKLCKQLNMLGSNLISVGNQLKLIRQDKTAEERDANYLHRWSCNGSNQSNMCWTQCKSQMQDMLQMSQLTVLHRRSEPFLFESDIKETPIRKIRCQKKIIQRVESILAKAETFNIRSETLTNVKVLAKMILSALVKRNNLYEFCCVDDPISNNKLPDVLDCNPYLQ